MKIKTKRPKYDWVLEAISISLLLYNFVPLFLFDKISEGTKVPIHFNLAGEVDGWGDSSSLLMSPIMALVIYIILTLGEKYPKLGNYPIKVTDGNRVVLYSLMIRLIRYIKPLILLNFAYIGHASIAIAIGNTTGLNQHIMIISFVSMLIIVGIYALKMVKAKNVNITED